MVSPRLFPGCSRIDLVIYCMGGYLQSENSYGLPTLLNEHISFDISQMNMNKVDEDMYFSKFNSSQLEWKQLSNRNYVSGNPTQPTAHLSTTILSSKKSYITFGGLIYNSTGYAMAPDNPFMEYNVLEDTWYTLPIISNTVEILRASIINIGNDVIWKYGGTPALYEISLGDAYSLFDYKNLTWIGPFVRNVPEFETPITFTTGHTITLAGNIIYKLGGRFDDGNGDVQFINRYYDGLNRINSFNTVTMKWKVNFVNGNIPSNREYHTSTYVPDQNLILIVGGVRITGSEIYMLENNNYAIYNITSNRYVDIIEPNNTPFPKERYGHYATIYNSKYLLLMFGGINSTTSANVMDVINISNPIKPIYITNFSHSNEEGIVNANHQLGTTTLIFIVVILTAVGLCIIIAIIYYTRRKLKKRKENIQLEKEDPRKILYGIKEFNLIKPNSDVNELNTQQQQRQDRAILTEHIKPANIILCKPYENQYEDKTLYVDEKTEESTRDEKTEEPRENEKQPFTLNSYCMGLNSLSSSTPLFSLSSPSTETQPSSIEICKPSVSEI
ncbi:unnamed protein product [Cunninghamella blakesleeana]